MSKKTVAIIGLGMIGGSIAKALYVQKSEFRVIASDQEVSVLKKAGEMGIIDNWSQDPVYVAKEADITVLCVPVCSIAPICREIAPVLKKGSIVTDVGSVKGYLQTKLEDIIPKDVTYIGAHPMAGSEKSGIDASDASLFSGRPFIIIRPTEEKQTVLDELVIFIKALRAHPVFMETEEHDLTTAMVSHMPHVFSTALMLAAAGDEVTAEAKLLAAGCFRDMTRVSGADPRMWTDICLCNSYAIIEQIQKVEKLIAIAKEKIAQKDEAWLMDFFASGRAGREHFGMFITEGKGE